jgi:hypothetical protein
VGREGNGGVALWFFAREVEEREGLCGSAFDFWECGRYRSRFAHLSCIGLDTGGLSKRILSADMLKTLTG